MKQIIVFFITLLLSINSAFASDRAMQVEVKTGSGSKTIPLYTDYYALVVGVGDYQHGWPKLPNPVKDVQEVAKTLTSLGFRVKLVLDPTATELREQLDQLVVDGEEKNRAILFYFAGHGHTLEEAGGNPLGYIIPKDAADPLSDKKDFLGKAVSMRDMESYARLIHSRHVLMVFDSCFSGALFTLVRDRPSPYIEEMISHPVRSFITAGDKDEKVPDRSVFKDVFIQGIKDRLADYNKDGYVTGDELGNYLQEKVVNYSNKRQHPQRGKINDPNLDKGDFVFLAGGKIQWEKSAPEEKDGRVHITSVPSSGKLYVDGAYSGETPQEITLSPGAHEIVVEKHGYKTQRETVEVRAGKEINVKILLEAIRGSIAVKSNPSPANVYLDGKLIGETPDTITDLKPLRYTVTVKKEGYKDWSKAVELGSGEEVAITAELVKVQEEAKVVSKSSVGKTITEESSPKAGDTWREPITGMEFVWVPGGSFEMGDLFEDGYANEKHIRTVRLDGFGLGKYEVTQGEWQKIMGSNPSHYKKGDNYPVENVSWYDAHEFIKKLNRRYNDRNTFRLPTEAEWEYAARSGGKKETWAGTSDKSLLGEYAWYSKNSNGSSHPVGQKKPNGLGLYDMSGNVREWCEDVMYRDGQRVVRDGSWHHNDLESENFLGYTSYRGGPRDSYNPDYWADYLGFRVSKIP